MKDLAFEKDETTDRYKISTDGNGSLKFVYDKDDLKQRIEAVLSMFKGEWEWNSDLGIPVFDEVFRKAGFENIALGYVKSEILKLDGVAEVVRLEITGIVDGRKVFEYEVRYDSGEITSGVV